MLALLGRDPADAADHQARGVSVAAYREFYVHRQIGGVGVSSAWLPTVEEARTSARDYADTDRARGLKVCIVDVAPDGKSSADQGWDSKKDSLIEVGPGRLAARP